MREWNNQNKACITKEKNLEMKCTSISAQNGVARLHGKRVSQQAQ